ncbi:MAG: DUF4411 family protein [Planctomycetota bacterium]
MADGLYCFDSSALIHAATRAYPIEVFASFWDRFEGAVASGVVIAPDEVLVEAARKDDGLHAWCKAHREMFVPLTLDVQAAAMEITAAVPSLVDIKKGRGQADPFVVALARVRSATVVTEEHAKPTAPKIPDACKLFGVTCINLLEFLRAMRWRF